MYNRDHLLTDHTVNTVSSLWDAKSHLVILVKGYLICVASLMTRFINTICSSGSRMVPLRHGTKYSGRVDFSMPSLSIQCKLHYAFRMARPRVLERIWGKVKCEASIANRMSWRFPCIGHMTNSIGGSMTRRRGPPVSPAGVGTESAIRANSGTGSVHRSQGNSILVSRRHPHPHCAAILFLSCLSL